MAWRWQVGHSYILQGGVASSSSLPPIPPLFTSSSSSLPPPSLLSLPLFFSLSSIFSEFWLKTKMPMASQALLAELTSLFGVVYIYMASLLAQTVKNLPAVQRTGESAASTALGEFVRQLTLKSWRMGPMFVFPFVFNYCIPFFSWHKLWTPEIYLCGDFSNCLKKKKATNETCHCPSSNAA